MVSNTIAKTSVNHPIQQICEDFLIARREYWLLYVKLFEKFGSVKQSHYTTIINYCSF